MADQKPTLEYERREPVSKSSWGYIALKIMAVLALLILGYIALWALGGFFELYL